MFHKQNYSKAEHLTKRLLFRQSSVKLKPSADLFLSYLQATVKSADTSVTRLGRVKGSRKTLLHKPMLCAGPILCGGGGS